MGFFKVLFNAGNAEGIREAMRISYKHHRKSVRGPMADGTSPHEIGLFGAMASRMKVNNMPFDEASVWLEVAPFMIIADEEVAREAIAEYAVFVERTVDAKIEGLRAAINDAFRRGEGSHVARQFMASPAVQHKRWYALLDPDVRAALAAR